MQFKSLLAFAAFAALGFAVPLTAHAQGPSTATLNAQATVTTDGTLDITDTEGAASSLTFSGEGGATVAPSEGVITVHAQVTTTSGNANTVITVASTNLTGASSGGSIPAGALSWTHATDSGGGTWSANTMSTTPVTLAHLPGSGTYSGDQSYSLAIPANADADVYTGTITYTISGF